VRQHTGRTKSPRAAADRAQAGASQDRPEEASRLLYADHVDGAGVDLFKAACANDIEGIVAKHKNWPYRSDGKLSPWLKIKNPMYLQAEGRGDIVKPRARAAAL
jgi:ATP-dependent DNA ligase